VLISVAIPAHNRPAFLLEALRSVANQTYQEFEVVVVDDGSTPPIPLSALQEVLQHRVRLHRHDSAQGVPSAKNAGIRLARGEIILLLDDDDLLRPDALATIHTAFSNYPEIDCLFLGVSPFGPYASGAAENRKKALAHIIDKLQPEIRDGIYLFSDNLFDSLLHAVPIDFQRPAARRGAWNIAGRFDESSLFSESAWALRAACVCRIALTQDPVTEWRIHDNNFGWLAELEIDQNRRRQIENGLISGSNLLHEFDAQARAWASRTEAIKKRQSGHFLSKAYYLRDKDWRDGIDSLWKSFLLSPGPLQLKLLASYFVPRSWFRYRSTMNKDAKPSSYISNTPA
jgi:glycosyltransferase involved in cell wall biosynthesis